MSTVPSAVAAATSTATAVALSDDQRPPPDVVATDSGSGGQMPAGSNVRHVSVPQMDPRPRRQEMMNRPSAKELVAYQQRPYGRSNSGPTGPDRNGHRTSGRQSPAIGYGGSGNGFKSKLRNSFRSTAKRVVRQQQQQQQQQTAVDTLAKNGQQLGLHNVQDSPRMMAAQRTPLGRVRINRA